MAGVVAREVIPSHDQRVRFILLPCREGFIEGKNTLRSLTRDLRPRHTLIGLYQIGQGLTQMLNGRTKDEETFQ